MPESEEHNKFIDITRIIGESKSELLKSLPGFIKKIIAKIVRENELNRILGKYPDMTGIDFLGVVIKEFNLDGKIWLV